jgi:hypothetical protein
MGLFPLVLPHVKPLANVSTVEFFIPKLSGHSSIVFQWRWGGGGSLAADQCSILPEFRYMK